MKKTAIQKSNHPIESSELIVTDKGCIYHLGLHPSQIANDIMVVGDPGRVKEVSSRFSSIESKTENREFVTHTGVFNGKRISVLSTGIGTDNIDIVINELDALVNIDLETKMIKEYHTSLNIVRLGTSGALQEDIPVDSFLVSEYAIGFDGVMSFYKTAYEENEIKIQDEFVKHMNWLSNMNPPYVVNASNPLVEKIGKNERRGITITANGFYGPQGRVLRLPVSVPEMNEKLRTFNCENLKITNYEMETSSLYGLCSMLGHQAATVCVIIANRYAKQYSKDYHPAVGKLIDQTLERMTS